jgi:membrane fusion protein (multidrug efflux system)
MKRSSVVYLLIALLLCGLIILKIAKPKKNAVNQPPPGAASGPSLVNAVIVHTQKLANDITASGTIIANEEAELRSEINGKITAIYFHEGSKVQKGELLVKIYDADLQAQLRKSGYQKQLALEKVEREKKLLAISGISQEEYDQNLNAVNTIKADVDLLNAQISKTEIRAPFNGTIGLKNISVGNYVSPTNLIASIQQIEPIKIDFSIPEKYEGTFEVGSPVVFTVQGSSRSRKAKIYALEPKVDLATRSIKARAIYDNNDRSVLPGAFAEVHIILKEVPNAIMIPTQAVIPVLKGEKVMLSKNGKAKPQNITSGVRTDTHVQVLSGLKADDTVIVTGIMGLKPGAKLKFLSLNEQ